jgi:hypothetical protein
MHQFKKAKRSSKRPPVNSPMHEDDSSEDELPEVVQDAEDEEEGCEDSNQVCNPEAETESEQVRQRPKKSRKQERSSNPRSNVAKKDKYGNRIWMAMLFKYKEDPVALGSLIASINSTADKTNCAENFEARLLSSTTRRIARAKKFPRSTALGGDLFSPSMAIIYSNMHAQDQVDAILKPMTLAQRAICGLPHKTGHELLYLPGHTSQADLKDMSY